MVPFQAGVPAAPELVVVTLVILIPVAVAVWTYRDATRRGSRHAANWAISMFLFGALGFFPMFVGLGLYFAVREEFEYGPGVPAND